MPFLVAMYSLLEINLFCYITKPFSVASLKYSNVFTSIYDFLHRAQLSSPNKHTFLFLFSNGRLAISLIKFVCSIAKLGNVST